MKPIEIIALISPLVAVLFSALTWRRNAKKDDTATAREMAVLTVEVTNNKNNISSANESLERNAEKILAKLEQNTEKLEARIERSSEKLEAKIEAEHCRIDRIEKGNDKVEH